MPDFTDDEAAAARALAGHLIAALGDASPAVAMTALSLATGCTLATNARPEGWEETMAIHIAACRHWAGSTLLAMTETGEPQ